ncbi:MAG: hypothetical protein D6698_04165, partial [Gammaproteobacteria bacterium]
NYLADQKWPNGEPIILRDYQVDAVNAALSNLNGVLEMATGSGKALPNDAVVYTDDGEPVKIGNLFPGDIIQSHNGALTSVIGVYPQGIKDVWEVEFEDGRIVECCEDHLWVVDPNIDNPMAYLNPFTGMILSTKKLEPGMSIPLTSMREGSGDFYIGDDMRDIDDSCPTVMEIYNSIGSADWSYMDVVEGTIKQSAIWSANILPFTALCLYELFGEEAFDGYHMLIPKDSVRHPQVFKKIIWMHGGKIVDAGEHFKVFNLAAANAIRYRYRPMDLYEVITRQDRLYIKDIRKTNRSTKMTCIKVADPTECFITGDSILTHNTIVCATISKIASKIGDVVVMVPNVDLLLQTANTFEHAGMDVGIFYGEVKKPKQVTITTWQSANNFRDLINDKTRCLIVDECHQAKASVIRDIITTEANHVPIRLGCSGSLPKNDAWRQTIKGILGPTVFSIKSWRLVNKGVLAQSTVVPVVMDDKPHFRKYWETVMNQETGVLEKTYFSQLPYANQMRAILSHPDRTRKIVELIETIADTGNTLVLVPYVDTAKELSEILSCQVVHGSVKGRDDIYQEFNSGDKGTLVATYGVASTGIDLPRIQNLVLIEPGKSFEKVVQTIGRGLRKAHDKSDVLIFDIHGNFGLSHRHFNMRKKIYKEIHAPIDEAMTLKYSD